MKNSGVPQTLTQIHVSLLISAHVSKHLHSICFLPSVAQKALRASFYGMHDLSDHYFSV